MGNKRGRDSYDYGDLRVLQAQARVVALLREDELLGLAIGIKGAISKGPYQRGQARFLSRREFNLAPCDKTPSQQHHAYTLNTICPCCLFMLDCNIILR
jgi:hypothetical protein